MASDLGWQLRRGGKDGRGGKMEGVAGVAGVSYVAMKTLLPCFVSLSIDTLSSLFIRWRLYVRWFTWFLACSLMIGPFYGSFGS